MHADGYMSTAGHMRLPCALLTAVPSPRYADSLLRKPVALLAGREACAAQLGTTLIASAVERRCSPVLPVLSAAFSVQKARRKATKPALPTALRAVAWQVHVRFGAPRCVYPRVFAHSCCVLMLICAAGAYRLSGVLFGVL